MLNPPACGQILRLLGGYTEPTVIGKTIADLLVLFLHLSALPRLSTAEWLIVPAWERAHLLIPQGAVDSGVVGCENLAPQLRFAAPA